MDERRTALEWMFNAGAAVGLLVILISGMTWRRSLPFEPDYWALGGTGVGLALLIGGVVASRRCKQNHLSKLITESQSGTDNAN